jgi:hypothetical protein
MSKTQGRRLNRRRIVAGLLALAGFLATAGRAFAQRKGSRPMDSKKQIGRIVPMFLSEADAREVMQEHCMQGVNHPMSVKHADLLVSRLRPQLWLTDRKDGGGGLGETRLGGAPDLPKGSLWPIRPALPDAAKAAQQGRQQSPWIIRQLSEAVPFEFIGQIELSQMSQFEAHVGDLPTAGPRFGKAGGRLPHDWAICESPRAVGAFGTRVLHAGRSSRVAENHFGCAKPHCKLASRSNGVIMTETNATTVAIEKNLAQLREQRRSRDWDNIATNTPQHLALYLVAQFEYDVRQGGFAQLIFNMQGACLAEIEDMLIAVNAGIARARYVRAIDACLNQQDAYFSFLESNYTDANALKNELQLISLDYLSRDMPFVVEANDYLERHLSAAPRGTP